MQQWRRRKRHWIPVLAVSCNFCFNSLLHGNCRTQACSEYVPFSSKTCNVRCTEPGVGKRYAGPKRCSKAICLYVSLRSESSWFNKVGVGWWMGTMLEHIESFRRPRYFLSRSISCAPVVSSPLFGAGDPVCHYWHSSFPIFYPAYCSRKTQSCW